ncbi:MAG: dynamin family protein [Truepera sp.]|nr:dynamin family protein [Truepera sp.]
MNVELREVTKELVAREKLLIGDLRGLLSRLDASESDLIDLKTALRDLEGIFMLVVIGEYNAGKSSLLNALVGEKVMPEGVTPTTDRVVIVNYGETERESEDSATLLRRSYPADILRNLALVDTPGTNAVITRHQELTERFIPRADLVLFVTSADRPFTESERAVLELIGSWGKKITLVVNKLDILEGPEQRQQVLDFVCDHGRKTLGVTPQVFGVEAKRAFRARAAGNEAELKGTGLPEIESYIETNLAPDERFRLKLLSPLGVARHLTEHYQGVLARRLGLLADDRSTLDEIERQRDQFTRDMRREFQAYLARTKTILLEVERRGDIYFNDTVRLRNLFSLMNSERIKEQFQARVIRDADKDIEIAVGETVDWFLSRNLQLWEDVMGFINERRQAGEERVIGEVGGRFQYDRQALIRALRERTQEVLDSYDEREEAERLADQLQNSVVQTGLLQVGGIGLGAAVLAFISSAALDITGVVTGLTLAGIGLLVIPRRRAQAKRELHKRMQELRDGLDLGLSKQLDAEMLRSSEKLSGAIAPYTRFVRSELERLESHQAELDALAAESEELQRTIESAEL